MRHYIPTTILIALVAIGARPISAQDLEVLHVWRTESEQYALAAIKDPLIAQGFNWADYWVNGNFKGIQNEFARRISIGDPPTVVQWIIGEDLQKLVEQNLTRKLYDTDGRFSKFFQKEVYDLVALEGGISALPVGIHTQNHIVYNKSILEQFNLSPAESWEELISYGPILQAEGIELLAASDQSWQIRTLGMSVFASFLDREEFTLLQTQGESVEPLRAKAREALTILSKLREFSHKDSHDLDWENASQKVADGQALAQVLGDYIIPQFPNRDEIVCAPSPQSNYTLWGVDSFIFPYSEDPDVLKAQDAFIDVATDSKNIPEYIRRKGGIPVTTNIAPEELDECIGNILKDWNKLENRLWTGGSSWQKRLEVLGLFLSDQWSSGFGDLDVSTEKMILLLHGID